MKIAICDDERMYIDKISSCIDTISKRRNVECEVITCTSGEELLRLSRKENPDAVFLDISMPGISGLETAGRLIEIQKNIVLVFVSSKEANVYCAYEYSPFWFVPKAQIDMLEMVVDKTINKVMILENENKFVRLNVENNSVIEIDLKKIAYFKTDDHYVQMVMKDSGKSVSYRNKLDNIEKQLSDKWFVRVHNRYLINCRMISTIENKSCVLLNGEQVPVSRSKMSHTKKCFQDYLRGMR